MFGASFAIRLLYWRATSDASWPHTAAFKGDALLWLEYARSLHEGRAFELGLPIHPPGTAYLIAALWGGGGFAVLKVAWCALGAATVAWSASAMARAFGERVGALAGVIMAASSGLLMLSTSLNGETPYLALVAAGFLVLPGTADVPARGRLAAWSALQAAACLIRVEHVLFVALALAFMGARAARRAPFGRVAALGAVAALAFVLPLVPWHVAAWDSLARFDDVPPPTPPPVRRVLDQLRVIEWDAGARARLSALPAFARDQSEAFIAATVASRGGTRVRDADFEVLRDAFGSAPAPLRRHPFVSLYGPLNFALANHPDAGPGFGHAALDVPPPLAGGPRAYPAMLIAGLPPRELALTYPPHVALVNDGYAMGARWLAADLSRSARRALARLARFWAGAATMVSGYALPAGLSGTRYAVDITVATGGFAVAWRIALLVVALAGVVRVRGEAAIHPWLFLLVARAVPAVAFFGYARLGATAIPVVALLVALAVERRVPAWDAGGRKLMLRALALLIAIEAARWVHHPALALDGDPAGPHDPVADSDHLDHELKVQF